MPTLGKQLAQRIDEQHGGTLTKVADRLKVTEESLLHLGLDPAFKPDGYTGELAEALLQILGEPLSVASCYPTACDLFPVIADGTHGRQGGCAKDKRFAEAVKVRAAVEELISAIQQGIVGNQDHVYRVELAGHGFTLVARRPGADTPYQVELIETIANGSLITPSLSKAPFKPDAICAALLDMVDDDMAARKKGAASLGWDATDFWLAERTGTDPVFPAIGFRWWSGTLRPDALDRWMKQFTHRIDGFALLSRQ